MLIVIAGGFMLVGAVAASWVQAGRTKGDAIATAGLNLQRALTDTTVLFDKLTVEAGSSNTFAANDISLQVKMSDKFEVSLGMGLRYNTKLPADLKKSDTLTTVNLVYVF